MSFLNEFLMTKWCGTRLFFSFSRRTLANICSGSKKNSSIMIRLTMKSMLAMLHVFCQHYYYFARSLLCKWGKRDFAAFFLPKNWCILYKEHQLPLTHSHFIAQSGITKLFAAYIIALHNLLFSIRHFSLISNIKYLVC